MSMRKPLCRSSWRSRSAPARRSRKVPDSASRSRRPTSRPGISRSCRTAPTCRPAAARRRKARKSTRRSASPATPRAAKAAARPAPDRWSAARRSPTASTPPKTIANYYAYATTVFDYIRRAMPYNAPRSLDDNEVYALTAYILSLNKLIGENDVMDAKTLPQVKMPNRDNFIMPYPDRI